jgi:hypothetical protein
MRTGDRPVAQPIGLAVRAGIHTGECETADGKAAGIAVVAGSGLIFDAVGGHELKGIPGTWQLYTIADR